VLAIIVSGAAAYSVAKQQPTIYEADSKLIVGPGIAGVNPDLNAFRAGVQLMRTYAELAMTRPILEAVVTELQLPMEANALKKIISVKSDEATLILTVQVHSTDAAQVVTVANALANYIVNLSPAGDGISSEQVKADAKAQIDEIKATLDQNKTILTQLEARQLLVTLTEEKRLLVDQINQIRAQQTDLQRILVSLYDSYKASNTNQIKVIELAQAADPVASTVVISTIMAAVAGLILALTFVLGFEYFNDTIRTIGDLAYTVNIPILATLVKQKRLQGVGRQRFVVHALPESRAAESYRVLSSRLLLSRFQSKGTNNALQPSAPSQRHSPEEAIAESTLRSVVISGTQLNENVSEIASNLAVQLAQTGHRVILVDGYLHQPSIHRLFGIPEQRGLADILLLRNLAPKSVIRQLRHTTASATGESAEPNQDSAIQAVLHETAALVSVDWAPGLQILTSGTQPTNPFELLVSPHMADLIKSLEKQADLVIIAASPLLSSADSLILASRVDGSVIVARSGKTRRDTMKEIVNALNSLQANILGAILDHHHGSDLPAAVQRKGAPQPAKRAERQAPRTASA